MSHRLPFQLPLLLLAALLLAVPSARSEESLVYQFVDKYCIECHDELTEEGKVNLEALHETSDLIDYLRRDFSRSQQRLGGPNSILEKYSSAFETSDQRKATLDAAWAVSKIHGLQFFYMQRVELE